MGKREIAIENGIPIPGPKKAMGPRTPGGIAASKLNVGDSIFCDNKAERDTARKCIYRLGGRSVSRRAEKDGIDGYRIWRVAIETSR